jgi:dTDP-4-dehydrorhamnose 3,5-epimerase
MLSLAERGVAPSVVDDQRGRLTFTSELARAIRHLIDKRPPHGTYNVTGSGTATSWADVARRVFTLANHDPDRVTGVSTDEYFASATGPLAPRPRSSVLDLTKIEDTGFTPLNAEEALADYVPLKRQHHAAARPSPRIVPKSRKGAKWPRCCLCQCFRSSREALNVTYMTRWTAWMD